MSKKSKLKRKKYQYTKYEFIQAVCSKCGLCKSPIEPGFCFDCVYKDNPKKFTKVILEQLFDVRHWLSNVGYSSISTCPDESVQYILQNIFCDSDFCGKSPGEGEQCKAIAGCLHAFRKQIKGLNNDLAVFDDVCKTILNSADKDGNVLSYQNFKSKKKQKYKYVVNVIPRTATFFCNETFRKEIGEILDGNND
jgi:hypothetical protein